MQKVGEYSKKWRMQFCAKDRNQSNSFLIQFAHRLSFFPLKSTVVKIFTFISKHHFSPDWYMMTNEPWAASKGFYCPPSHHPLQCLFHRNGRCDDATGSHARIRTSVFVRIVTDKMHPPAPYPNLNLETMTFDFLHLFKVVRRSSYGCHLFSWKL